MTEVVLKEPQEIADEIAEIEAQPIYSKEDQGRWRALVWVLGLDREPPWESEDDD